MTCNCNNEYIKRVIGVTRTFNWTITTGGEDVSLEGRNLTLQLMEPRGSVVDLPFSTTGDVVSFTWQGDDQTKIGLYSLILWENYGEDSQRRVDIHNFVELIPWSDNEQGTYSDLAEETITLETSDFGADVIVEDNLTSTSTSNALSANMGRALNITKQDVIADLATIRSGAAAGAAVKEWAKNDVVITDDGTQATASKLSFNGNIFEQWISGVASSITLKGIAGFLKLADISQWGSAYNDRMLPTVAAVKSKIDAVANALATIEAVIPSQASSSNKLTDKNYVDGAIATNTANFVGTFATLAELQAVQNPTKNDYGFVIEQDAQGNEYYDRYKYTGSQWLFEYKVESTPFTAEQWAAIQSGITAALVSKLSALPTNAELNTALAGKQPVINDLPTIRSGAAAGATAYQKPSGGIPASDMASAVQTSLGKADSAYQKPSSGIPASDMTSAVQTSLGKADAAAPQSTTYTKTEVDAALATKQTSSQLATINGSRIDQGGNVTIVAAEGQTITIDAAPTARSNNAVSSGGVYEEVNQLHQEVNVDIQNAAFAETYIQPINYELGNISINVAANTWVYSNSSSRVRTPEGYTLHLFPGDTIGLSSYDNARFYIGWRKLDGSSGGANGWRTSDYTVTDEGIYCILVCNAADTVQTSAEALGSLINVVRNTTLSKRVGNLKETQNGISIITEADLTLFEDNNYITNRGVVSPSTSYKILSYSAQKGDYIYVRSANSSSTSTIANGTGTNKNSLVVGGVPGNEYRYVVGEDGTIYISINKVNTAGYEISIIRNNQYKCLLEQNETPYNSIEGLLTKQRGYIKFSDGSFNNTGSLINVYQFAAVGIKKVKVYVTGGDEVGAAIAFYSTDTISTTSYISGVRMNGNYGGGRWYESDVPSNAVLIAVTNHASYCPNPLILVNNLSQEVLGMDGIDSAISAISNFNKTNAFTGGNPFRFNGPFYAHLFLDKIYETSTDITIPSESLDDIRVSRRLGFNVIEANVHTTSDGKFVVIHGASGKFGYEVTDLEGNFTYADTAISSVSLDWIKTNIRYRSDIPRFRTAIPTLEEFLRECRLQGMIPFAQASTAAMVALLDGIMGYGNYFAYNGTRALTSAPIVQYLSLTTKEAILEQARSVGVPYVYAMGNYNAFTDNELKDIVSSLHSEGFMIATAYVNGANADRVRKLGFDMIASSWNVNDFDNANLCTLCVGTDWDDFQITGSSATDAGVELGVGDNITPANALGTEFLAKGMLQVTFTGTIGMKCGKDEQEVTSDGVNSVIFSSYFINSAPTFMVYGKSAGAVVTDIVFKASKC